jgi:phage-related minor tail protein
VAGTIKGMTIEIGGNTAPLEQALKDTNKEIRNTQKELNEVDRLLKLDPKNVELIQQKQQLLGDQIGKTTTKLDALKQAQAQLDAQMKNGTEVNQEEYRKLQREIISTESSLKKYNEQLDATNQKIDVLVKTQQQ